MLSTRNTAIVFTSVFLSWVFAAQAQDVMTLGSVSGARTSGLVTVPISVQDLAGTPLDTGTESHRNISSLAVTVEYTPAGAVTSAEIERAGLTAGLTPRFETQFTGEGRHSWIVAFQEAVPFTGGSQTIGELELRIASGVAVGTQVVLTLAPETTALSNSTGTLVETEGNGGLTLVDGNVEVTEAGCTTASTLCLLDDRFRVEVDWTDFQGGQGGGTGVQLTDDAGYFWFFNPENVEMVIKVLDGRGFNGNFWVFYGALSNVEYEITVTDSQTGQTKTYSNPSGTFASVGDTAAFQGDGSGVTRRPRITDAGVLALTALGPDPPSGLRAWPARQQQGDCIPGPTTLCLLDDRFRVESTWEDFAGGTGVGQAVPLTDETGYFWFFNPDNVELVVKTLDGRGITGHFWVFYGALSNVEFNLEVTDTVTDGSKAYFNPSGTFASVGDTMAFP